MDIRGLDRLQAAAASKMGTFSLSCGHQVRDRWLIADSRDCAPASWSETAARGQISGVRNLTRDWQERGASAVSLRSWNALQKGTRVGMRRRLQNRARRTLLDKLSRVHHSYTVRNAGNEPEIVRNVQSGHLLGLP